MMSTEHPSKSFLNLENAKQGFNEVMLFNETIPQHDPDMPISLTNPKMILVPDRQGINDEFYSVFQAIVNKQDINESPKTIKEFLDSDGDTQPMEFLKTKVLVDDKSEKLEGEITHEELKFSLFTKMKCSSAPSIMDTLSTGYWNS